MSPVFDFILFIIVKLFIKLSTLQDVKKHVYTAVIPATALAILPS